MAGGQTQPRSRGQALENHRRYETALCVAAHLSVRMWPGQRLPQDGTLHPYFKRAVRDTARWQASRTPTLRAHGHEATTDE